MRYADDFFSGFDEPAAGAEYRYFADETADCGALGARSQDLLRQKSGNAEPQRVEHIRAVAGYGGYGCMGDPGTVARELASMSAAGFGGVAIGFVNYLDEFAYFRDEVLPRLEALGVRQPR